MFRMPLSVFLLFNKLPVASFGLSGSFLDSAWRRLLPTEILILRGSLILCSTCSMKMVADISIALQESSPVRVVFARFAPLMIRAGLTPLLTVQSALVIATRTSLRPLSSKCICCNTARRFICTQISRSLARCWPANSLSL